MVTPSYFFAEANPANITIGIMHPIILKIIFNILILLNLKAFKNKLFNENSLVQLQKKTCFMIASLALLIKIYDYSRLA